MHIEIFRGKVGWHKEQWYWHFNNKGRVTADSEAFPSKGNALRASKAVVLAVLKPVKASTMPPIFSTEEKNGMTMVTWR